MTYTKGGQAMRGSLTRWNPVSPVLAREPFFRLLDSFFSGEMGQGEELSTRTWTPPVDIHETPEAYQVQAELPGMTREDIDITLEHNVLRLTGERKLEKEQNQGNFHRLERYYGTFARSFSLPAQVNAEGIQASFKDGVLSITVPKAEQAKPRKISIN
jgi:HSP20 family protein